MKLIARMVEFGIHDAIEYIEHSPGDLRTFVAKKQYSAVHT